MTQTVPVAAAGSADQANADQANAGHADVNHADAGQADADRGRITTTTMVLLGAMTGLGPFSMSVHLPGLPRMADDLAASQSSVQLTMTACVVGIAVGQVVAGPLSDAYGRRRPLLVAMALYCATSAVCAAAWTVPMLAGLRFAQGMFAAFGMTIARAVIRDVADGQRLVRLFARMALVSGLTPIIAPNLGSALLVVTDWRGIFVVLAVLGALFAALSVGSLSETLSPARRTSLRPASTARTYAALATDGAFLAPSLVVGLAYGAMFSYVSSSSFVLSDAYGVSQTVFGVLFAANAVGFMAGGQLGAALAGRRGTIRALRVTLPAAATAAAGIALAALAGSGPAVVGTLFLTVASIGACMPIASAEAMRTRPDSSGTASGLLGLTQFALGGLIGPIVGAFGSTSALPLGIGMCLCLLAAFALCLRPAALRPTPSPAA
ncbi:multidrug effflux MFS transporter [Frankia sp. AiPs1]|uniref:multidrug effflux MFS transporter n=1 Tax=Frankia sp. AiPs1 TaxID=573493 RepID=UPI00204336AB|nr:multidrug effflux MFS transporter [Frankia sp. AiPs1]MCM3922264.1 multidrug effflux MFS transporter [Frankia sp. AiPs1]